MRTLHKSCVPESRTATTPSRGNPIFARPVIFRSSVTTRCLKCDGNGGRSYQLPSTLYLTGAPSLPAGGIPKISSVPTVLLGLHQNQNYETSNWTPACALGMPEHMGEILASMRKRNAPLPRIDEWVHATTPDLQALRPELTPHAQVGTRVHYSRQKGTERSSVPCPSGATPFARGFASKAISCPSAKYKTNR